VDARKAALIQQALEKAAAAAAAPISEPKPEEPVA